MSDEQHKLQSALYSRRKAFSQKEAIEILKKIGVMKQDGTLSEEYKFLAVDAQ